MSNAFSCQRSGCNEVANAPRLPDGWLRVHAFDAGHWAVICDEGHESDGNEHAYVCPKCAEMLFDWWCNDFERTRFADDEDVSATDSAVKDDA